MEENNPAEKKSSKPTTNKIEIENLSDASLNRTQLNLEQANPQPATSISLTAYGDQSRPTTAPQNLYMIGQIINIPQSKPSNPDPRKQSEVSSVPTSQEIKANSKFALVEALKRKYQAKPVAFIKRFYYEQIVPIEKSFINLAIIKQEELKQKERQTLTKPEEFRDNRLRSYEDIHQPKQVISLAKIFDKGQDKEKPKHLLIEGRAGIGKTTLCSFIANRWSADDEKKLGAWIHQFTAIIWLPLRQLRDFPKVQTVAEFVQQVCLLKTDQEQITVGQIRQELSTLEEKQQVLYLLDGYDEITDLKDSYLLQLLLEKEYWLLTSRPYCDATQVSKRNPDRHLESVGFVNKDIRNYVEQFFENFHESEKAGALLALLEQNPNIKGIAYVPINLELICTVCKEENQQLTSEENKILTMTLLYEKILCLLVRRYLQERCKINVAKMLPKHYETHPRSNKVLAFLEALAWKLMEKKQLMFKPKDEDISNLIEEHFPNSEGQEGISDDIYKHIGLLKGTGEETTTWADQSYYFIHLTFQEYFAARYVVNHLEEEIEFIRRHKYHPRYQIVWWFVAGLLNQKQDKAQLQIYFDLLLGEPKTLREIDRLSLVWRCWDEAGLPKIKQHQKLLERLIAYIGNLPRYWYETDAIAATRSSVKTVLLHCLELSLSLRQQLEVKVELDSKMADSLEKNVSASYHYQIYDGWLALMKEEPTKVIKVLQNRLESQSSCAIAIEGLAKLGYRENTFIKKLLALLQNKTDAEIQMATIRALIELGCKEEEFTQNLLALLQNKASAEVQMAAIEALVELGCKEEEFIQNLLALLHGGRYIRVEVIESLVKLGSKEKVVIQKLLGLLGDLDKDVRVAARGILVELGKTEELITQYKIMLRNEDWVCRTTAIKSLIELGFKEKEFIQKLKIFLQDESEFVRTEAIEGLVKLGIKEEWFIKKLLALLEKEFDEPQSIVKAAAIDGLVELGVKDEKFIKKLLVLAFSQQFPIQEEAIAGLVKFGVKEKKFIQKLLGLALLQNEKNYNRVIAIDALVKLEIRDESVIKELFPLIHDEDSKVQLLARESLIKLGVKEETLLEKLVISLRSRDKDIRARTRTNLGKLKLSDQTWFDCLSSWNKKTWSVAKKDFSTLFSPIPLRVLLRLWTNSQGLSEPLEIIVLKMKDDLAYWHEGTLYYYQQQQPEKPFPLTQEYFSLLYRAFLEKFKEPLLSEEKPSSKF